MIAVLEEVKGTMQQPSQQQNYNEFLIALNQNTKQLEKLGEQFDRLNERSRDFATRSDLEVLRKELVARDSFDFQMNAMRMQTTRVDTDRIADRAAMENRIDHLEQDQISRQDRLWIRLGQIMAAAAFLIALFELLSHVKWLP